MRVNVDRVLERDQKLTDLDSRAGNFVLRIIGSSLSIRILLSSMTLFTVFLRLTFQLFASAESIFLFLVGG